MHDYISVCFCFQAPDSTVDVTLDSGIYLVDTDVDVKSITVNSNAILVFNDADLSVRTRYILVRGELYLGSEKCKLTSNIDITLYGKFDFKSSKYIMKSFHKKNPNKIKTNKYPPPKKNSKNHTKQTIKHKINKTKIYVKYSYSITKTSVYQTQVKCR